MNAPLAAKGIFVSSVLGLNWQKIPRPSDVQK
jgi:hypothetical protein